MYSHVLAMIFYPRFNPKTSLSLVEGTNEEEQCEWDKVEALKKKFRKAKRKYKRARQTCESADADIFADADLHGDIMANFDPDSNGSNDRCECPGFNDGFIEDGADTRQCQR